MSDNPWKRERENDLNFWGGIIGMVLVAIFASEHHAVLFFLAMIWVMLFEISGRLRTQYDYHRRNTELLSELAAKADN